MENKGRPLIIAIHLTLKLMFLQEFDKLELNNLGPLYGQMLLSGMLQKIKIFRNVLSGTVFTFDLGDKRFILLIIKEVCFVWSLDAIIVEFSWVSCTP